MDEKAFADLIPWGRMDENRLMDDQTGINSLRPNG